jgi:hypothetical protein
MVAIGEPTAQSKGPATREHVLRIADPPSCLELPHGHSAAVRRIERARAAEGQLVRGRP